MLYITLTGGRQLAKHLGDYVPSRLADEVTEVQADGDELSHILNTMNGLPTSRKRVVNWFGDDAKFIVSNW